jgi:hypothetical protein
MTDAKLHKIFIERTNIRNVLLLSWVSWKVFKRPDPFLQGSHTGEKNEVPAMRRDHGWRRILRLG